MRLGIVTGLADEARIARRIGDAEAGGGTSWGAEVAAERLVSRGATALLSFGLCGGLDPHLRSGDLIVPLLIVETGGSYPTDGSLSDSLAAPIHGVLFASETILGSREAKQRLFRSTQASGVDLESGAMARVAMRHGLPFAALRAVCDTAADTLPPAALVPLGKGGRVALGGVLRSVARRPSQIPELIKLSRNAASARAALVNAVRALLLKGRTDP